MKRYFLIILLVFVVCAIPLTGCNNSKGASDLSTKPTLKWNQPPAMEIDANKSYTAVFETSLGSFRVELLAKESPLTVNNFIFLSRQGFYDGVIFHRILQTFMIQSGDPTGTGSGGPGYSFKDELPVMHSYEPGIMAMANSGPNTNGSQFFICTGADARGLDAPAYANYTQFGRVSAGMDVVLKIAAVKVTFSPQGEPSRPIDPPVINSIEIIES